MIFGCRRPSCCAAGSVNVPNLGAFVADWGDSRLVGMTVRLARDPVQAHACSATSVMMKWVFVDLEAWRGGRRPTI